MRELVQEKERETGAGDGANTMEATKNAYVLRLL